MIIVGIDPGPTTSGLAVVEYLEATAPNESSLRVVRSYNELPTTSVVQTATGFLPYWVALESFILAGGVYDNRMVSLVESMKEDLVQKGLKVELQASSTKAMSKRWSKAFVENYKEVHGEHARDAVAHAIYFLVRKVKCYF